jgi:hypothetical protein
VTRGNQLRFLILTLSSGENEFDACCESVRSQGHALHEHRIFKDLSKADAHARLYGTIMESGGDFDLFLKLDADMVLADDRVLSRIATCFDANPELDHLVLGVADWFTDTDMIGVHTFSRRARWRPNPSGLFTDPDPVFPGRKIVIRRPRPVVVHHGADPDPFQAFSFGVHRAMKACQSHLDRHDKRPFAARMSWQVLTRVWRHYQDCEDLRLGLAVRGADLVLRGQLPATAVNRADTALVEAYRRASSLAPSELRAGLEPDWGGRSARLLLWTRSLGGSMAIRVALRSLRDAVTAPVRELRYVRQERQLRL